jgi:hypothetical protein
MPNPGESSSQETRRWREMDSNHRSLARTSRFCRGRRIAGPNGVPKGLFRMRYRWFESISLQQTVSLSPAAASEGREPRFSARVWAAGLATGSGETRQALDCWPTGCNISVGPYSSTAVPLRWLAKMPRRSRQSWVYSALKVRGSFNSDWLKQSRAQSADRARQAADVSAQEASLTSSRSAGAPPGSPG